MAQAAQTVGTEQQAVLEEMLLGADVAAGEAVQRRLTGDVQGLTLGADVDIVEPAGAAVGAQAQAVEQHAFFQPALLRHQLQPGEVADRLPVAQGLQQRVAVVLGHAGIAHRMHVTARAQPQPGQHARLEALRRGATVEQVEALLPQAPKGRNGAEISGRATVAKGLAPGILVLAAVDQGEAVLLVETQAAQQLAGRDTGQVDQQHIVDGRGQQAIQVGETVRLQPMKTGKGSAQDCDSGRIGRHRCNSEIDTRRQNATI